MLKNKNLANSLMASSAVAVALSAYGAVTQADIVLAPTQWLLVAIALGIFGLYVRM